MEELLRSNDIVVVSFIESLLKDSGIPVFVADENMSVLEGSIGILRRRVLVPSDRLAEARQLVRDADLEAELP